MAKTRVAVVESDLETLSRIYLGLLHRNFRVETATDPDIGWPVIQKLRPQVVILGTDAFDVLAARIRVPAIVYLSPGAPAFRHAEDVFLLRKPVQVDELVALIGRIAY